MLGPVFKEQMSCALAIKVSHLLSHRIARAFLGTRMGSLPSA